MIEFLERAIATLVLIMPKMSGYVQVFQVKDEDKDDNKSGKYKAIWTKIEDISN